MQGKLQGNLKDKEIIALAETPTPAAVKKGKKIKVAKLGGKKKGKKI